MIKSKAVSPAQCRAARAILFWTQAMLADRAGVARKTIADFERNSRTLHIRTRRAIATALEGAGIRFISGDQGREAYTKDPGIGSGVVIGDVPVATDDRGVGALPANVPAFTSSTAR